MDSKFVLLGYFIFMLVIVLFLLQVVQVFQYSKQVKMSLRVRLLAFNIHFVSSSYFVFSSTVETVALG